ncbi:putative 2-dehydropantoate 2-reductase [Pseudooceanicola batsensis HTCC2597]|uniref:2-dehydropantoate 2-reductase n=1 Tax=Pseudooceanicola batsensis (strain ATCC BAA-863 / DSM 15984 / KCTC 12145 / HTCC2597) TaxID=252305 RepID=A3U3K7_PSEBH|nr:2-dehydropantoate 2-reductase [Pseudooceanicola batsensis]EAQ01209.1 putative 2-dehydropantoate 2-reductase [Pseudooceanicola batsensis HTCC2597]
MTLPPLLDRPLDICVYGAGAIGGVLAATLTRAAGTGDLGRVTVIARGRHLDAMQRQGLRLRSPDGSHETIAVTATDDPASLPRQDVVITALKGHQIPPEADRLAALMAPHARILPVVNGVPWWYPIPDGAGGTKGVEEVDPGGVLWRTIGPERAIGSIAYLGASVPEPGLISYDIAGYLDLGRLPGQDRGDVARIAALLEGAGWMIRQTEPFQNALWTKMMSNCSLNAVSAITRTSNGLNLKSQPIRDFTAAIMEEVRAIAAAEQAEIAMATDKRLDLAGRNPEFKTSTLQDLEKGRPMEIEPIFAAAVAVGRARGVPCPNLDLATEILRQVDRSLAS